MDVRTLAVLAGPSQEVLFELHPFRGIRSNFSPFPRVLFVPEELLEILFPALPWPALRSACCSLAVKQRIPQQSSVRPLVLVLADQLTSPAPFANPPRR